MWKKYKDFLRKRTDMQLLIYGIIAGFLMGNMIALVIKKGIIVYVIAIFIILFAMLTIGIEVKKRTEEYRKEIEREK